MQLIGRVKAACRGGPHARHGLGRWPKLTAAQIAEARDVIAVGQETATGMATLVKFERTTLWRALKR